MMNKKLIQMKGRRESGGFMALPHAVLDCENFKQLDAYAVKFLIDLFSQFKGSNNGDLCAAWSIMSKRGWRSKATLRKAILNLLKFGMITVTRQGGRKLATLYAVTFLAIDECGNKLDVRPTKVSSGDWKVPVAPSLSRHKKLPIISSPKKLIGLPHTLGHIGLVGGTNCRSAYSH